MSKYLDDSTRASRPANLTLSLHKLEELEPAIMTRRTYKCGPICHADHPAEEMRERFAEHLAHGLACPALVVSLDPLVVAVYADDLDAAVLLEFPESFASRHGLALGSRLLGVCLFLDHKSKRGVSLYAADIVPGPKRSAWTQFTPFIAEYLSDDMSAIERLKKQIDESEWNSCEQAARVRIGKWGVNTARSGRPTLAGNPIALNDDRAPWRTIDQLTGRSLDKEESDGLPSFVVWILLAGAVVLLWYLS